MKTTAEKIAVMQAFADGKRIIMKNIRLQTPIICDEEPEWNWADFDYCAEHFKCFVPGTCDWKDSLVRIR